MILHRRPEAMADADGDSTSQELGEPDIEKGSTRPSLPFEVLRRNWTQEILDGGRPTVITKESNLEIPGKLFAK